MTSRWLVSLTFALTLAFAGTASAQTPLTTLGSVDLTTLGISAGHDLLEGIYTDILSLDVDGKPGEELVFGLWKYKEGTKVYVLVPKGPHGICLEAPYDVKTLSPYISSRLTLLDVDGDGRKELLVTNHLGEWEVVAVGPLAACK